MNPPRFDLMRYSVEQNRAKYQSDSKFLKAVQNSWHGQDVYYSNYTLAYARTLITIEGTEK